MKDNLYLKIITPDGIKYGEYVKIATIETISEGFEGFMYKHLPMVSEITIGQMAITNLDGNKRIAAVSGGFIYNDGNELKILTPYFEFMDLVDRNNIVQNINTIKQKISEEKNENKLRTLNIALTNENNKLKAIDNVYKNNQQNY
ncbi:MAG: ATP synthase F1 subunit epsilon [Mycoplasmataceae bacterium]|nr:ATP synthase F1 subunit epsilon [Mycoplasmataceae bacterium]